jgi:hypothetical protein
MDIENIETLPTVDKLYHLIGQENIMSFYLEAVKVGKKYVNPFRDDRNPSCFFKWTSKGNLYFVDYATEKVYFSPLDVAQLKTGYEFPEVLYKIESDFRINDLSMHELESLKLKEKEPVILDPADIRTTISYFKTKDLDYWEQFGITPDILSFYDVKKVEKAWINGKLWYIRNDFDPCYRYLERDKVKLYRPFAEKKSKFRTNFFGGMLEGWNQLPEYGDELIVTKGRKDVMTLYSCGINAVAVRSENTPVSENAFNLLKSRFQNIKIWYDNDGPGQKACTKMQEMYGLECIRHDVNLPKDPSDIYKELGKEKVLELIKNG